MFQQILDDLESFVSKVKERPVEELENEIQTAILLTGDYYSISYISQFHLAIHLAMVNVFIEKLHCRG